MPILPTNWEFDGQTPFLDFSVGSVFTSHLPGADLLAAGELDQLFGVPVEDFAMQSFTNYADLSVRSIYQVARNWGVEEYRLEGIGNYALDLLSLGSLPYGVEAEQMLESSIIGALDLAFSVIGVVPVVGWILEGAYEVGKTIADVVQLFKDEEEEIALPALNYSASLDQQQCDRMLEVVKKNDWTRIFQPSVIPNDFEGQLIEFGTDRDGVVLHGYAVRPVAAQSQEINGFGVLPGLPQVFGNIQLPAYYPQKKRPLPGERPSGWGQKPPFCAVSYYGSKKISADLCHNIGDFLPSVRQLGFGLWSMVRTNSATAFKIDQNAIMDTWQDFFAALIDYIEWQGDKDGKNSNAFQRSWVAQQFSTAASCGSLNGDYRCTVWSHLGDIPGFADFLLEQTSDTPPGMFFRPRAGRGLTTPRGNLLPGHFVTYYALVAYFMRDQLRACKDNFLKTVTVAYVDETFPAIRNNVMMRRVWDENRRRLLEHPARMEVELDLIPDDEYRGAMERAQRFGGLQLTSAVGPLELEAIPADIVPYPHHRPFVARPTRRPRKTGGGGGGLVIGLAALAAFAALKK